MENIEIKNKNNTENQDKKIEEVVKITISKEAEINLGQILGRVNDGFDAGRINRQELASWALNQFAQGCDADQLRMIRQEHFDEFAFLESILKRGKENGKLPADIKTALKAYMGVEFQAKRVSKKSLTQTYINDVVMDDGEESKTA